MPTPSAPALTVLRLPAGAPGLAVVLLPGLGGNARTFSLAFMDTVATAVGAGAAVAVTYGLPFGPSISDAASTVWAALAFLLGGGTAVLLVGYSMGGFVAQAMADQAVTAGKTCALAGLVLLSSAVPTTGPLAVPLRELVRSFTAAAPRTAEARLGALFPSPWLRACTASTLRSLVAALDEAHVSHVARAQEFAAVVPFLVTPAVGRLRRVAAAGVPVLCLHGDADVVLSIENARTVAAAVPGVTLVEFPGAGHGLLFQAGAEVAAAVAVWWRRLPPRSHGFDCHPVASPLPASVHWVGL